MNTILIAQTWAALGPRHQQFIEDFYTRFFERFPAYRKLFPAELRHEHLAKMVGTIALLADLADDQPDIAPRLRRLGEAHEPFDLKPRDYQNFKEVFLEVLARDLGAGWTPGAAKAWEEAFDRVLIPALRARSARGARA